MGIKYLFLWIKDESVWVRLLLVIGIIVAGCAAFYTGWSQNG